MVQKHQLPDLPYDYNALEPAINAEIMELHHSKHHNAYVTNLNGALEKLADAEAKGDVSGMIAQQSAIKFNGGGHLNHSLFWENLAPEGQGGGEMPSGKLADAINAKWGSLDNFIADFNSVAGPVQGSGWGWLAFCPKNKILLNWACANQDPLQGTTGLIPLLGIDVWEHAYYLQYKNARPEYLKNVWKVVNWAEVAKRYEGALVAAG